MSEKIPIFKWNPWADMDDKKMIKIATKYYPEIDHPERMMRYDLIQRLDAISSKTVQATIVDVNPIKSFFLRIFIPIRDYFDKKKQEYWAGR